MIQIGTGFGYERRWAEYSVSEYSNMEAGKWVSCMTNDKHDTGPTVQTPGPRFENQDTILGQCVSYETLAVHFRFSLCAASRSLTYETTATVAETRNKIYSIADLA
jgi:hypothetical protein